MAEKKVTVKVDGIEIDLDDLKEEDVENMSKDDIEVAILGVFRQLSEDQKVGIKRALMRYENTNGLTLERALEREFG